MIQFDDMREMERRASVHCEDGLLDIGIGVGLLLLGFAMVYGFASLALVYLAAVFSIVRAAKRSVTVPRMHHLDFMPDPDDESRSSRIRGVLRATVVVLIVLGVCALLMSRIVPARISAALRSESIVLFGMTLTGLFILIGWGTAVKRMRVYAAIAGSLFVFGYWFGLEASWYLMIIGAVMVIWGAVILARFIRDYPKFHNRNGKVYQRTW